MRKIVRRWPFLLITIILSTIIIIIYCPWATNSQLNNQRFQLKEGINVSFIAHRQISYGEYQDSCEFEESKNYKCLLFKGDGMIYLPPYPITLPYRKPKLPEGNTINWDWIPIDKIYNGRQTFIQWQKLALSGKFFDCDSQICHVIVEGMTKEQQPTETTYAVCEIAVFDNILGAPERCDQIALIDEKDIWLKAIIGTSLIYFKMGLPDFSIRIFGSPPLFKLPTNSNIATAIKNAFFNSDLKLESENYGDNTIIAAASFRVSPVLDGWREIITIRVDIDKRDWAKPEFVGITISTTLYVNKQNTSTPKDWTLPTEQQESLYLDKIRNQIKFALNSICKTVSWKNHEDILCDRLQ